ncbi:MBL fold metallo-hydrolase [Rhodococcus pyridinivorans]|jgi:glyoxylase-like metal-dependent hydrolase (beta-lactamase superfamily II)/rhodanese-related sulfurtransferase|uniref:Rhodanese-like domain-containing protein n=1 Tax=Nocardia thailandica TaxID=257275 RepID=A0ABW6PXW1_9NOCA|nr:MULTISPECIES: MBL fold metallo-hydrolase [Nocardiaceae]MBF6290022.1 MBL fold metallo-hydrolase [Nocardia cyriacigeorgica]MBF6428707.1 MBL fold metallo-hydrolase [Nocardia cyriacigeorgica]PPJ00124.1 MBL fold metallo-hydrolase [Nocardia cyriacigeorgica]QQM55158.1 MBL fold metallo-hydrolase [Rhodococcus pyridinivorans]BDU04561.1 MBL fold hydrolase [Nocardia cyriacigeorgica]
MILEQYYIECLSHASYLIGDESTGRAIVVDPRRDITEYLDDARRHGLTIEGVINTHFHADFVSGHLELLDATGAWIGFGEAAETDYPIRRLAHGEHVSLGEVDLEVLSTPGHTWESISLLVRETPLARPTAVLTGDSLFIGDVGRPDLVNLGDGSNTDLARAMYRTIHQTLLNLPDSVTVMPAHGAGSSCGKNLSTELTSTIGEQRQTNPSVQPMSEDSFVALITDGQPAVPEYFHVNAALNKGNRAVLDRGRSIPAVTVEQLRAELAAGTRVLDARTPDDFAAEHLRGSVNVGFDGRFAETGGMVAEIGDRIVLITYPGEEQEAALRLSRIGSDEAVGYFNVDRDGGFPAGLVDLLQAAPRTTVEELGGLLADGAVTLVDIRNPGEREFGFIPGSIPIPLAQLRSRVGELPGDRPIVVHCAGGWRSSVAASLLRVLGIERVSDLIGGYNEWIDHNSAA